jgi:enoyl-CoA hydratase
VLSERRGEILLITLNRPEARNAANRKLAEGVAAALETLDTDTELRVGVLTGSGRGFCAGMDLKAFLQGELPFAGDRGFAGICRRPPKKPTIAAIEGFAVAGGLEIALGCDLLVAARGAKLGIPEVQRGLIAAAGALFRLPRRLPHHVAMQMALTGEPLLAERAYDLGLVNLLTEPGRAVEAALALANQIATNAPLAVQASKELVLSAPALPDDDAWRLQDLVGEAITASADAREGAAAFAEKRSPAWVGR